MADETFTVGDMSMAAYGYLAGYALLGVEKAADGYTRFVFYADDSRAIQQGFNDPKTTVPLQQYLAALKYLQTLRSQTKAGTTNWLQN
jgi:hypothetical protein